MPPATVLAWITNTPRKVPSPANADASHDEPPKKRQKITPSNALDVANVFRIKREQERRANITAYRIKIAAKLAQLPNLPLDVLLEVRPLTALDQATLKCMDRSLATSIQWTSSIFLGLRSRSVPSSFIDRRLVFGEPRVSKSKRIFQIVRKTSPSLSMRTFALISSARYPDSP
jgi:hypothetical protein